MPRIFNQAACNTCRLRKVKCDESVPICQRCSKANRYCDRSVALPQSHSQTSEDAGTLSRLSDATSGQYPSPKDPRKALQNPLIARYFHHYISQISPWYDLSDSSSSFGTIIPEAALDNPLPFAAILAVAAVHTSQTTAPSAKAAAEFYHGHCVRLLIELTGAENDEADAQGLALASVCLLRSYEILSEEVDPNRHLRGAYSLAAYRSPLVDYLGSGLRTAGFWNYLREDITFSLFERCPLKIDLKQMPLPTNHNTDHSYLNTVSLILGQIVNECFTSSVSETAWEFLFFTLHNWFDSLPSRFRPFSKEERGLGLALPSIWMLQDCHAAALHYQLVCMTVLCAHSTPVQLTHLKCFDLFKEADTREAMLDRLAVDVCGVAFTANVPAVLVNSFGPIAYCGRFIREEASRQEVIRRLMACKRAIGWPVQRLVSDLQNAWAAGCV